MIKILAKAKGWIEIGRLGENEHRMVCFPETADVIKMYPDAVISVLHKRPSDSDAYPVSPEYVIVEDGMVCWLIQSGDLAETGRGQCEIVFVQDNVVAKTMIYETQILPALDGAETPPDPWQGWQEQVAEDAQRAEAAAELLEHPNAVANTLEPGSSATASYSNGTFTFGIPEGKKGDQGIQGIPGRDGVDGKDGSDYQITPEDYDKIADEVIKNAKFDDIVQSAEDAADTAHKLVDGKDTKGVVDPQYSENNAEFHANRAKDEADRAETLVGDLAKEETLQEIESETEQSVGLLEQILEAGHSSGDLNGYSLAPGSGGEVILSYTDPETEETSSVVMITETTGAAIAEALAEEAEMWRGAVENAG